MNDDEVANIEVTEVEGGFVRLRQETADDIPTTDSEAVFGADTDTLV